MVAHAPVHRAPLLSRLAVALTVTIAAVFATAAPSSASETGDLISRINSSRASGGVGALTSHGELMARAQEWSNYMAARGRISHSTVGARVKSSWSKIAENVGVGSSTAEVHQMFMNSSGHRRNIMDSAFQYVGVGATWRDGRVYVAEIFMRLQDGASASSGAAAARIVAPRATRSAPRTPRATPAPAPAPPPKPVVPIRIAYSLDALRGVTPD